MSTLSRDGYFAMLAGVEHSLQRWEAQPAYHEPSEAEPFARWRAGERDDDLSWLAGWHKLLREATGDGRRFSRVRRLTDPLTPYLEWGMAVIPSNAEAGEVIRLLDEHVAARLGLPEYDFVIVDDRQAARLVFSTQGLIGAELMDPTELDQHRRWWSDAWDHAETINTYASRSP